MRLNYCIMPGKKVRSSRTSSHNSVPLSVLSTNGNNNGMLVAATANSTNCHKRTNELLLAMTKDQLKNECRKRGQKTTGNKNELLQRLGCYKMATNTTTTTSNSGTATASSTTTSATSGDQSGAKQQQSTAAATNNSPHGSSKSNNSSPILLNTSQKTNNSGRKKDANEQARRLREKLERESLVLWRRPIITIEFFVRELITLLTIYGGRILSHKKIVALVLITLSGLYVSLNTSGPHQKLMQLAHTKLLWCLYWIGLGILSSVGLGTGLHTFLLYLGPHIAQVTLAAYECESLNFPEPPYPDEIVCPTTERNPLAITIFSIMAKVRVEAMCWGAGTALGELPPYFMARAARLSGIDPDDEDDELKEFEELQRKQINHTDELTLLDRGKLFMEEIVEKVGFLGILACASIPNPLFDLAGITCGHFLVPFWTFFGATLIGKAIIKMHLQKLFVIIAFNERLIEMAVQWLEFVPIIGAQLQVPFKSFLDGQKLKLHKNQHHHHHHGGSSASGNILGSIFEKFVFLMILYFVLSIVNSLAQSYHKRVHKRKHSIKLAKD